MRPQEVNAAQGIHVFSPTDNNINSSSHVSQRNRLIDEDVTSSSHGFIRDLGESEEERRRMQYLSFMRSLIFSQQQQQQPYQQSHNPEYLPYSSSSCLLAGAGHNLGPSYSLSHEDSRVLKLELVYGDGGEYGSSYACDNLFKDDLSVYCTSKSKNVNILLTHSVKAGSEPVPFVITGLIIKSPSTGYTCPLKDGLIFVSDEPISHESTSDFDGFTEEKYRMFMKSKLGKRWGKHSPAIYFKIDQKKPTYIRDVKSPRFGRYVLIKLLNSHGKGENIDVQYIGFKGYYGRKAFPSGQLQ